jgi:hypothetical protein
MSEEVNIKPKRKKLSPEEKSNKKRGYRLNKIEKAGIVALLESGKGVRHVARETGRTPSIISIISKGNGVPIDPEQVEQIKRNLSAKLYKRADEAVDFMGDGRLNEMNAFQLAGIAKHTIESDRRMVNESTTNLAHIHQVVMPLGSIPDPKKLRQLWLQEPEEESSDPNN